MKYIPKILIVDDKPENLYSLEKILSESDSVIVKALNGNEALKASINNDFALAILDVQMPDMDGYEVAEFMRSEEKTKDIPIIFLSAVYSDDYHVFKGYKSGAVDFLTKPFNPGILMSKVNIFLQLDKQKVLLEEQLELEKSKKYLENILMSISDAVIVLSDNGTVRTINSAAENLLGYTEEELIEKSADILFGENSNFIYSCSIVRKERNSRPINKDLHNETNIISKDGREIPVHVSTSILRSHSDQDESGIVIAMVDMTERRRHEDERIFAESLLDELHKQKTTREMVKSIATMIQGFAHIDAVGVRLVHGEDSPYYYTNGFPNEFIEAERFLCARDSDGKVVSDSSGNISLECLCGNIISRKTTQDLPFFTDVGSFWTNSTTELLATTTDADRQVKMRNMCNSVGFESVALIPLRFEDKAIGLIQLNDRRHGMFTPERIEFLESIASSVGMALGKQKVKESLWESEGRLRLILNATDDTIFLMERNGTVLMGNNTLGKTLNVNMHELPGVNIYNCLESDIAASIKEQIDMVFLTGNTVRFEHERKERYFDNRVFPLFDENGNVSSVAIFAHDISNRKQMEKDHKSLMEQLVQSQKMEAIGQLAGGIAHDFNNMLGVIMGYTEIVMERAEKDSPSYRDMGEVIVAAERAKDLTMKMLTFARREILNIRPFSISKLILQLTNMLQRSVVNKKITITANIEEEIQFNIDENQIMQSLINLCNNSCDAMADGGELEVFCKQVELNNEYCKTHMDVQPGQYVLIIVRDTGEGMSKDVVKRALDPFFTTKEIGKGTGLGLSTTHGIVKSHGGHMEIESVLGTGTTIKIYLPFIDTVDEPSLEAEVINNAGGVETILLVDDEKRILDLAGRELRRKGYNPIATDNGEEAIKVYREKSGEIAAVVLDMLMPGMDGIDVAIELRKIDPEAKILVASGYSNDLRFKELLEQHNIEFIQKPFKLIQLSSKIRRLLDGSSNSVKI